MMVQMFTRPCPVFVATAADYEDRLAGDALDPDRRLAPQGLLRQALHVDGDVGDPPDESFRPLDQHRLGVDTADVAGIPPERDPDEVHLAEDLRHEPGEALVVGGAEAERVAEEDRDPPI